MIIALQTEHPEGIANLEQLISIDGIVGTIIGPNDLAINLSRVPGNPDLTILKKHEMYEHDTMKKTYQEIAEIAENKGKVAGVHFAEVDQMGLVEQLVGEMGYRLILLGTEANLDHPQILGTKERIEKIHS